MATLGERLRQERQRAGLSVEDLSARTKIQISLLEAIERDDFAHVPAGLFARGFLRAYAREVGLDPEVVVADYRDQHERPARAVADAEADTPRPSADASRDAILELSDAESFSWRKVWPAAAVAAVVLGVFVTVGSRSRNAPVVEPGAVGTTGAPAAAPAKEAAETQPRPAEPLTLGLHAKRDVWVAASADGKRVMYRIVKAGEQATITATAEITARVGDAAAFDYSVNGVAGPPLGSPGEVRDIIMTPGSVRTFKVDRPASQVARSPGQHP